MYALKLFFLADLDASAYLISIKLASGTSANMLFPLFSSSLCPLFLFIFFVPFGGQILIYTIFLRDLVH